MQGFGGRVFQAGGKSVAKSLQQDNVRCVLRMEGRPVRLEPKSEGEVTGVEVGESA